MLSEPPASHGDLRSRLGGIVSAFVTPFDEAGRVAPPLLDRLIELQLGQGIAGLYVGGSTGEALLQDVPERARMLRETALRARGRTLLIAHVGAIATDDALRLAEVAAEAGYDAIAAIPPFYYGFGEAAVVRHYEALATAGLPLLVYNIPSTTNVTLGYDVFAHLLRQPGIVGLKHTSTDFYLLERLKAAQPAARIFNGFDECCLAGLAAGADGAIGTTYNFMGDLFVALQRHVSAGELDMARRLQSMANRVIDALVEVGVIPGTKAILASMSAPAGPPRRPFPPLDGAQIARLQAAMTPILRWRSAR